MPVHKQGDKHRTHSSEPKQKRAKKKLRKSSAERLQMTDTLQTIFDEFAKLQHIFVIEEDQHVKQKNGFRLSSIRERDSPILIFIQSPLVIHGQAEVRSLSNELGQGRCTINGSAVSFSQGWIPVYAPTTHAALVVEAESDGTADMEEYYKWLQDVSLFSHLETHKANSLSLVLIKAMKHMLSDGNRGSWGLVQVRQFSSDASQILDQISSFPQYAHLFSTKCPQGQLNHEHAKFCIHSLPNVPDTSQSKTLPNTTSPLRDNKNEPKKCFHFILSDAMRSALTKATQMFTENTQSGPILLCGTKDSGKSSFLRCIYNQFLSLHDVSSVAFLDMDIGQPEFTPSGLVSLSLIRRPRFGPPFTHQLDFPIDDLTPQQAPVEIISQCFVGSLTPTDDPWHYIECVSHVYNSYLALPEPRPFLFINTMGWMQGLGLRLLIDAIVMTRPQLVIHLQTKHNDRDAPCTLTKESMINLSGWKYADLTETVFHHETLIMQSCSQVTGRSSFGSAEHRNLTLLSYILRNLRCAPVSLPLPSMQQSPVVTASSDTGEEDQVGGNKNPEEVSNKVAPPSKRSCEKVVRWLLSLQPVHRQWRQKPSLSVECDYMALRVMQWRDDIPSSAENVLQVMNANLVALCHIKNMTGDMIDLVPTSDSQSADCEHNNGNENLAESRNDDEKYVVAMLRENPICECLGLGIIRAVEFNTTTILLLTSLNDEKLMSVNCILKGVPTLPPCLLTEQPSDLHRFYVETPHNVGIGRKSMPAERKFLKVRRHLH